MRILSLLFLLLNFGFTVSAQNKLASLPKSNHDFIVIAHRGDHVHFPENTIAAFREAIKNEVDYIEVDLRTSKDSVLVVMHDATVDRTTNGIGRVNELDYATLQQLKITNRKDSSSAHYSIPTFEEVLQLAKNRINIYLDFKNADVQQTIRLIKQYEMEKQVVVYINTPQQFEQWRKTAPHIPLMISLPNTIRSATDLTAFLQRTPVELLDGNYSDYTREMVYAAIQAGIHVWPDIQSAGEAGNWDKAIALGVEGLQTDHPAELIAYLKKKKLR